MRWPIVALVRQRRSPAGWWPVLFRWPPTARGCGVRDSGIGSPRPRRARRSLAPSGPVQSCPQYRRLTCVQVSRWYFLRSHHDSPPQVVVEVVKAALARGVAMVVGPTRRMGLSARTSSSSERFVVLRLVSFLMRYMIVAECSLAWEAEGDELSTAPGSPQDAESEEVEAVVYVGDRVSSRARASTSCARA